MKAALKTLLDRLDEIGKEHDELFDTACRGPLGDTIFTGFLAVEKDFRVPDHYGLYEDAGNKAVKQALTEFLVAAGAPTGTFHERLSAFQDTDIVSSITQRGYDSFFGWHCPEDFKADGTPA